MIITVMAIVIPDSSDANDSSASELGQTTLLTPSDVIGGQMTTETEPDPLDVDPNKIQEKTTRPSTDAKPTGSASLVIIGGKIFNSDGTVLVFRPGVQIYTVKDGNVTWNRFGRACLYPWYQGGAAVNGGYIYIAGKP